MIIGITAYRDRIQYIADNFAGAGAIYSCVRKHRSAYTGSAIRVQRSSDSTQQDIGFGSDGLLDQSALTSFVGGGNGDVVTVYDQSGNGYDVTAAASQQWRIVTSGTVNTDGGQPKMIANGGTATGFILTGGITSSDLGTYSAGEGDQTIIWVGGLNGGGSYGYTLYNASFLEEGKLFYRSSPNTSIAFANDENGLSSSISTTGAIVEIYWDAGDDASYVYAANSLLGTDSNDPTANVSVNSIVFGAGSSFTNPDFLQELIIFNQSHYDSRADLYALISDYYTY